jgi:hypothetical protein
MEAVNMMHRMVSPVMALLVATACSGRDVAGPTSVAAAPNANAAVFSFESASRRSGPLHIQKECSTYTGQANDICTITKSNLRELGVGSVIRYAQGATADGMLSSDVTIDPPGRGENVAFGHCALSLVTGIGECRISGGTGEFKKFRARAAVSPLGLPNFAWDGQYSFGGKEGHD